MFELLLLLELLVFVSLLLDICDYYYEEAENYKAVGVSTDDLFLDNAPLRIGV